MWYINIYLFTQIKTLIRQVDSLFLDGKNGRNLATLIKCTRYCVTSKSHLLLERTYVFSFGPWLFTEINFRLLIRILYVYITVLYIQLGQLSSLTFHYTPGPSITPWNSLHHRMSHEHGMSSITTMNNLAR